MVVRSVVAGELFRVVSILEPLHHEIELTDGEQEKPVMSKTVMAISAARERSHTEFSISL